MSGRIPDFDAGNRLAAGIILAAYGLIWRLSSDSRGKADTWKIHQDTVELLEEAGVIIPATSVPEMSGGE